MRKFPLAVGLSVVIFLLSIFSSVAQASWSTPPVYNVTARQPAAPNPGANVPNQGNVPADTPVSGTITATFTWTHDVLGDSPPSKVYVLQHGSAGWGPGLDEEVDPGGGGEARTINPSTRDALFLPRSRPRFRLIQAQGTDGKSDNGMDDPQIVNTPGTRGESTGYKIVVCNSIGNTVTTPPLTLKASKNGTPTFHYKSHWSYNAVVMDVKITRNGTDITSPNKPEVPVMVGEQNQMGVSFSPAPPDVAPPTYQWTIPGDKIKNFVITTGDKNANPPTFSTGKKVELPAADLTTTSPKFYWYNSTFAGDSKEVKVDVTVDGETYTLKSKCKVYRPNFDGLTITYQKQKAPHEAEPMVGFDLFDSISFTPLGSGAKFAGVATVPNTPTAAGQIGLQQVVTTSNVKVKNEVVVPHKYEQFVGVSGGVSALDSLSEDQIFANPASTAKPITPGTAGGIGFTESEDQPNVPSNQWTKIDSDFAFTMYLMYKPNSAGSIWVPLGKNNWGWGFNADDVTFTKNWSFNSRHPTVAGAVGNAGLDTHDIPEWDLRIQQSGFVPIAPW